ncbi:hypothetical protein Ancab_014751 [Ancistrocladus abbreviatus]
MPQSFNSIAEALTTFMRILNIAKESLKKIFIRAEMLNRYFDELQGKGEGENEPAFNFLVEGIQILEEAKGIGLPNFLSRTAFLTILQSKVKRISRTLVEGDKPPGAVPSSCWVNGDRWWWVLPSSSPFIALLLHVASHATAIVILATNCCIIRFYIIASSAVPIGKSSWLSAVSSCKVTSEDSGKTVSGESILLVEQSLERDLEVAIKEENYAEAARIRDNLRVLHEDSKATILTANARFYNAFRNGDLASMQALWVKGDHVCCVHPGASGISGYDLVMRSWEYVWVDYEFPLQIELKDVQVHVRGDVGYVTCVELVKTKGSSWGRQFATNVFERVDGQWHICTHHASPVDL